MYCKSLWVAAAWAKTLAQNAGPCLDGSPSFGRDAHGVNELVVRLGIIQL
jgi:hypothetical protein